MRARSKIARGISAALLTVSAGPGFAQTQPDIEEIIVTARSIEDTLAIELSSYGHDVNVVGADRINAGGYLDVSTALQFEVPGLFVSPGSGPFDYVDVALQGSRTGDVLWLIDGVRINNRIFNGTSPDTMPSGMVERVEVLKGGESLFYGTQGVAGAINIVTRSFGDLPGGQATLSADSNDGTQISAFGRGAFGDHNLVVYASRNEGEGFEQYSVYQPSATDRKRGYDVKNFGMKYGYDFNDRARLDLFYHHVDALLDNNAPQRTRRSYNHRDEDVASVKLSVALTNQVELLVKSYLHDWDTPYANIQNHPVTGEEVVIYPPGTYWGFRDYGANALVKITPDGPAEYHVGYDYQNYKARDEVFPISGDTETVNAVFAHVRSAANQFEKGSAAFGLRYNRGTSGKTATVGNFSGRYEFRGEALYLQGNVGTAFLLPSAEQLYYVGFPPDDYAGNPDLEPEESTNLNVTLGGRVPIGGGALGWTVTAFARDIDNLINIGCDDPLYPNCRYENVPGVVEVRGTEAALAVSTRGGFRINLSHTYTQSRMEGSNLQLQRIPENVTQLGLGYAPAGERYDVSLTSNRVGNVYQNVGAFGRNNFGDYTIVNLSGRISLDERGRHRIGLNVQNIGDKEYATRLQQGPRDDGTGNFLTQRLGVPRTASVTYTVNF